MTSWLDIFIPVMTVVGVILLGALFRHLGYLNPKFEGQISKLIADIALPAILLATILNVDRDTLINQWHMPLWGGGMMLVAYLCGLSVAWFTGNIDARKAIAFTVGTSNWFYLPYPVLIVLAKNAEFQDAISALVLITIGMHTVAWSFGIWILGGRKLTPKMFARSLFNPGFVAALIGVIVVLVVNPHDNIIAADLDHGFFYAVYVSLHNVIDAVGKLALPATFLVAGARLGDMNKTEILPCRFSVSSSLGRVILVPAVVVGILTLAGRLGFMFSTGELITLKIIAAAPVATSSIVVVERYGGDPNIVARSIFYSTLLSLVTLPLWLTLF